jgi:hypothetical protein
MGSKMGRLAVLAVAAATTSVAAAAATQMEPSSSPSSSPGGAVSFTRAPPPSGINRGLRLSLVQVLSRHGDRTSINPLPFEMHE